MSHEELNGLIQSLGQAQSPEDVAAIQARIDGMFKKIQSEKDDEVVRLKSNNERVIEELRTARKRAEALKLFEGRDEKWLKEAEDAIDQRRKAAEQARIEQGEFDQLKSEWQRDRDKERELHKSELQALRDELVKERRDNVVNAKAAQYGIRAERIADVRKSLLFPNEERIRLSDADQRTLNVYDAEGKLLPDSVDEFFKTRLREERPDWYQPTGNGGGGAPPNGSAREEHTVARSSRDGKLSPDQIASLSQGEYEKARAEGRI